MQDQGRLFYAGRHYGLPKAFKGYPVALRRTARDGELEVLFRQHVIASIDRRVPKINSRACWYGRRQGEGELQTAESPIQ